MATRRPWWQRLVHKSAAFTAREADGEERDMYWRRANEICPGFNVYERTASSRRIGVFVLEPTTFRPNP